MKPAEVISKKKRKMLIKQKKDVEKRGQRANILAQAMLFAVTNELIVCCITAENHTTESKAPRCDSIFKAPDALFSAYHHELHSPLAAWSDKSRLTGKDY